MIKSILIAFVASATASVLFNISRRNILWSACTGTIGWSVYQLIITQGKPAVLATFAASLIIGLIGESFAILRKKPATIFILPGIIPLVPGAGMYFTMVALQAQDVSAAASTGIQTAFTALAIACGLVISLSLLRLVRRQQQKNSPGAGGNGKDLTEIPEHPADW